MIPGTGTGRKVRATPLIRYENEIHRKSWSRIASTTQQQPETVLTSGYEQEVPHGLFPHLVSIT